MTRKHYEKRIYMLYKGLHDYAKANGQPIKSGIYKVGRPNFGCKLPDGTILRSYQQAYDLLKEYLGKSFDF